MRLLNCDPSPALGRPAATWIVAIVASLGAISPGEGRAQRLEFVRDLNPTTVDTYPRDFCHVGSRIFFIAQDARYGTEVWVTDATRAGSRLVKDIRKGHDSSLPELIGEYKGQLLFAADDGVHGKELWISDGTMAGTKIVKDLRAGGASFFTGHANWRLGIPAVVAGGIFYFVGHHDSYGRELWRYDGKTVQLVHDIAKGTASSEPIRLTAIRNECWFQATTKTHGSEVYRSAGTSATTTRVTDIAKGSADSNPSDFVALGKSVFFAAERRGIDGRELWRHSGTTTTRVADLAAGTASSNPEQICLLGTNVYFLARRTSRYFELWRSDGSASGTQRIASLPTTTSDRRKLRVVGRELVISRDTPFNRNSPPKSWTSDGKTWRPYPGNARLVDSTTVRALMYDDNTRVVFTYANGRATTLGKLTDPKTALHEGSMADKGPVLIRAYAGAMSSLWTDRGATAGTLVQLRLPIQPNTLSSSPRAHSWRALGSRAVFETGNPRALWSTDGTSKGTEQLLPTTFPLGFWHGQFAGRSWFCAGDTGGQRRQLWSTDGTKAGTSRFGTPILRGLTLHGSPAIGARHLWFLRARKTTIEMWVTDGTLAGTRRVELQNTPRFRLIRLIAASGDHSLIEFSSPVIGKPEYYRVHISGRTRLLLNASSFLRPLGRDGGRVLYSLSIANVPALYEFDGNALNRIATLPFGATTEAIALGDRIVLSMGDGLRVLDRTTRKLVRLTSAKADWLARSGDRIFFATTDVRHGTELWLTDGSKAGTKLVHDVWPGTSSSRPRDALVYGDAGLVFTADIGPLRARVWFTDGARLQSIHTGTTGGGAVLGDAMAVGATFDGRGLELCRIRGMRARARTRDLGCGSSTREPTLVTTRPALGSRVKIEQRDGPATGIVALAMAPPRPSATIMPGGCPSVLDLSTAVFAAFPRNGRLYSVIPNSASLHGVHVWLRAFAVASAGAGIEATNVVDWAIAR